jgi:putative ABC transport system substrate-binding protein
VTGTVTAVPGYYAKLFQLATELVPGAKRIGYLLGRDLSPLDIFQHDAEQAAANYHFDLTIGLVDLSPGGLEKALHAIEEARVDALVIAPSPYVTASRSYVHEFVAAHRLPDVYQFRERVVEGGLMSYGVNLLALFRHAAYFVDLILRGTKPGDLPFESPTVFDLVVNMKTAKALGITIAETILINATEIIE